MSYDRTRAPLSPEKLRRWHEEDRLNLREIADLTGWAPSTISAVMRAHGIAVRSQPKRRIGRWR